MKKETIEKGNKILNRIDSLKREQSYLLSKKDDNHRIKLIYYDRDNSDSSTETFLHTPYGYDREKREHGEWLNEELQHITERLISRYDKSIKEAEKELENLRD